MVYRKDIDGLRAVAILPVLFFHAGFDFVRGGFVGVDVFFVISGYLITGLILKEKEAGSFSLFHFYERRARRILPALFLVMLCCLPFGWLWLLPNDLHRLADSMIAVVMFVSNIHFYRETGYFAPDAELQPLLHTWSLSIEEQFYLLFPLLIIALWPLGKRALFRIVGLITFISLLAAQFGGHLSSLDDLVSGKAPFTSVPESGFYLLQTRAWELLVGSLTGFYLHRRDESHRGSEILSVIGLALIVYAILAFDDGTPHPSFHTLLPVGGTAMIILFATRETACARLLSAPLLVGIGLISYSVYLWHQPLFAFFRILSPDVSSDMALFFLALLSLVLGWLSWRFVERPFRDPQKFSRKQIFAFSGSTAGLIFGLGMTGHVYEGFLNRFQPSDRPLVIAADNERMGRYVNARFNQLQNQPFKQDARLKVLVVGDSYGQDFINMLAENGALDHVSVSTHQVVARCGNLYLKTNFMHHIKDSDLPACIKAGWYGGKQIQENLKQADVMFLVSSWIPWTAKLLPESIDNLKKDFDAKILLIGTKFFGEVKPRQYLGWSDEKKRSLRNSIEGHATDANRSMSKDIDHEIFIDASRLFCGSDHDCPVFTPDLKLISYDGYHLTKEGAVYLGKKLMGHPLIREALNLDVPHLARQDTNTR